MADNVYLGNPNLKKANTAIEFTPDQIKEFIKCKQDPVYFARNYIKIVNVDEGLVNFEMWPFQEKLISRFHENRFNICMMRDRLVSPHIGVLPITLCVFSDNVNIGILANKHLPSRSFR